MRAWTATGTIGAPAAAGPATLVRGCRAGRAAGRPRPREPRTAAPADGPRARLGGHRAGSRRGVVADPADHGQRCMNSRFPMLLDLGPRAGHALQRRVRAPARRPPPGGAGRRSRPTSGPTSGRPCAHGRARCIRRRGDLSARTCSLVMSRDGFDEETFFTFSFSPVVEPGGRVAGMLDTVVETTGRVLATRRMGVLQRLGSLPRSVHGSTPEAAPRRWACSPRPAPTARSGWSTCSAPTRTPPSSSPATASGPGTRSSRPNSSPPRCARRSPPVADRPCPAWPSCLPGLVRSRRQPRGGGRRRHRLRAAPHPRRPGTAGRRDRARHQPAPAAGRGVPGLPRAWPPATCPPRSPTPRPCRPNAAAPRSAPSSTTPAPSSSPRSRSPCSARCSARRCCPRASPSTTSRPAGTLEVGGDWYDVVDLPGGRYGVVVGDVVGRGLAAAAVMGQLRSAVRALLLESHSPAHVLERAGPVRRAGAGRGGQHGLLRRRRPGRAQTLRYSSAGHLPAILVARRRRVAAASTAAGLAAAGRRRRPRPAGGRRRPAARLDAAALHRRAGRAARRGRSTRASPGRSRCCARAGALGRAAAGRRAHRPAARRRAGRRRRLPALPLPADPRRPSSLAVAA